VVDVSQRVKHYEEAVVKNIDRPTWHPEKASTMFETWKDKYAPYAEIEELVKVITERRGIPTGLRVMYLNFARKVLKLLMKRAPRRQLEALARAWATEYGLRREVLTEILRAITSSGRARVR